MTHHPSDIAIRTEGFTVRCELSPRDCLADGWSGFKQNARVAVLGNLLYMAISFVGGKIPVVNVLFDALIMPVFTGGLTILSLNLVRNQSPQVTDIFRGFERWWSFLGAGLLIGFVLFLFILPVGIGVVIDESVGANFPMFKIVFSLVSAALCLFGFLRWWMVFYLIADGNKVLEAFRKSPEITKGYRGAILVLFLLVLLINIAGIFALFVGLLVTLPVMQIALASAYVRLTGTETDRVLNSGGPK
jgi:hypothetical protein